VDSVAPCKASVVPRAQARIAPIDPETCMGREMTAALILAGAASAFCPAPAGAQTLRSVPDPFVPGVPRAQEHVGYQSHRRKCADEDQAARRKVQDRQGLERAQRDAEKIADQAARQRVLANPERCAEMLRILHAKRQRTDLQRSEATYLERCKG
jgi:hypothetical protein